MHKSFQNNAGEKCEHPPREMLMLFVDGELASREATQLEAHLEACWPCRVKTKKIQETIADIVEFDEQVLTPRIIPPQGWRNFDSKLSRLAAASGKQSLSSRLFGSLNRFLPSSHLFSFPRPLLVRRVVAVLTVAVIVGLLIRFKQEPIVSASELLKNAASAQSRESQAINEAVLHQKLQVSQRDQASTTSEQSISWEIWNDTKNSRVRQFFSNGKESEPINSTLANTSSKPVSRPDILIGLTKVLEANHMDLLRPVSATSYLSWYNTLNHQQDEVTKSRLPDGSDSLILRTVAAKAANVGQISEAVFVVRAKDWKPTELRLSVTVENGNRIYELAEKISEVVTLTQVHPAIFADQPIASPLPAASPKEFAKTQPTPALSINPEPLMPAPVATADLEVEALRLLNQVGADLGEQINVKRMADGLLHINGIVETDQRKTEILNVLSLIAANPAARIEIQTVAEAVAAQRQTKPTPLPSQRSVQITGNTMAAEPELRAYFAGKAKNTDEAIRQYAARMVSLSGQAMDHLWAMKRLLNQFSAEQVRSLTPEGRAKWLGLIRTHGRLYQKRIDSLRRELHPVFFLGQPVATASSEGTEITDPNQLAPLVKQLFELGSSNDRVIRSAFTSSSTGGVMTTVIKDPQFWQSLKSAEALAARISR